MSKYEIHMYGDDCYKIIRNGEELTPAQIVQELEKIKELKRFADDLELFNDCNTRLDMPEIGDVSFKGYSAKIKQDK